MTTPEDLYYGNIHPHDRDMKKSGKEATLLTLVVKNENTCWQRSRIGKKKSFKSAKIQKARCTAYFNLGHSLKDSALV